MPRRPTGSDITDPRQAAGDADMLRTQAAILAEIRDAVVVTDAQQRITYWNDGATRLFGYTASEMLGRTPDIVYPPGDADLAEGISGEFIGDWRGVHKDGSDVWVRLRAWPLLDEAGVPVGGIGVATDITERKSHELQLSRLATAVEQSTDSVVITDAGARIVYVNPAFERLTGYRRDEVMGQNPRVLKSGKQSPSFYRAMWSALANGVPWAGDMINRRKDGSLFQEEATVTPIFGGDGKVAGYVAVKRDVTRERALEAEGVAAARERALIVDTLLLLPSGMSTEATGQAICQQMMNLSGLTHAHLFLFDDDGAARPIGFAAQNGRGAEPRRLPLARSRHLSERAGHGPWIEDWVPSPDHPFDEVLTALGVRSAAYVPVRSAGTLVGLLIAGAGGHDQVTATAALTTALPGLMDLAEVAGTLLRSTLQAGSEAAVTRDRIRAIIDDRAFRTVFQPIVSLSSGHAVGYEGLTRFRDGVRPDRQFADARRVGLQRDLELATMRAAVATAARLPSDVFLSLNASPTLITDPELVDVLAPRDAATVLEVTEHESIVDYDGLRAAMAALGPGVSLAADDAGAGVANFGHLVGLRPRYIKLDRALVQSVDRDPGRQALAVALGHFAASTEAEVIAEGIETTQELRALMSLRVGLGQGYLLGRPGSISTVRPAARAELPRAGIQRGIGPGLAASVRTLRQ